jgi:phosphopantetheine adenylyltransferase
MVDTIASMLGVLDGVSRVTDFECNLELSDGSTKLNGLLQDLFLAADEEATRGETGRS